MFKLKNAFPTKFLFNNKNQTKSIINSQQLHQAQKRNFSVSVALVGYPNVGKSTFFNALVKRQIAEARNLPFCTIEPNIAKVDAVDETLLELAKITNNHNLKAFKIEVMDVAGLIKDSMKPDGSGVRFLACIRSATAIVQVLRCFKNPDITYMDDIINPLNEMEVVQTELILSDIDVIDRKIAKGGRKVTEDEKGFLEKIKIELNSGKSIRNLNWKYTESEKKLLDSLCLISRKPFIYVFNVDPPEVENELTRQCAAALVNEDNVITSVLLENEALQMAEDAPIVQSLEIINEYFATFPNFKFQSWNLIQKIIKKLDYVTFYSVGDTNVNQSWLIKKGSTIIDAANAIHSDLARHFICAEITRLEDWQKYGSEEKIRNFSKVKTVAKDYVLNDGDIVNIKARV